MHPDGPNPSFVLCDLLSRIFVWYQTTISCVKLIALLRKQSSRSFVVSEADILSKIDETICQIDLFLQFHKKGYISQR